MSFTYSARLAAHLGEDKKEGAKRGGVRFPDNQYGDVPGYHFLLRDTIMVKTERREGSL